MRFSPGDEVVVKALARKRGIIVQAASDGRYRVRVENVTVWCREDDITAPPREKKRNRSTATATAAEPESGGSSARAGRVDLHGLTVEESLARLMDAIEAAVVRGADRVEVIHGKGSGRVKHAVHQRLASMPSVAAFKLDERNAGVTWVFL